MEYNICNTLYALSQYHAKVMSAMQTYIFPAKAGHKNADGLISKQAEKRAYVYTRMQTNVRYACEMSILRRFQRKRYCYEPCI